MDVYSRAVDLLGSGAAEDCTLGSFIIRQTGEKAVEDG